MSQPIQRISINTGGGDAPGLNAVIYAVVHARAMTGCCFPTVIPMGA